MEPDHKSTATPEKRKQLSGGEIDLLSYAELGRIGTDTENHMQPSTSIYRYCDDDTVSYIDSDEDAPADAEPAKDTLQACEQHDVINIEQYDIVDIEEINSSFNPRTVLTAERKKDASAKKIFTCGELQRLITNDSGRLNLQKKAAMVEQVSITLDPHLKGPADGTFKIPLDCQHKPY